MVKLYWFVLSVVLFLLLFVGLYAVHTGVQEAQEQNGTMRTFVVEKLNEGVSTVGQFVDYIGNFGWGVVLVAIFCCCLLACDGIYTICSISMGEQQEGSAKSVVCYVYNGFKIFSGSVTALVLTLWAYVYRTKRKDLSGETLLGDLTKLMELGTS